MNTKKLGPWLPSTYSVVREEGRKQIDDYTCHKSFKILQQCELESHSFFFFYLFILGFDHTV